jgi:hypothetical protein
MKGCKTFTGIFIISRCFIIHFRRRSFKSAMQSGAFIQLILTLAAVAARMDALIPEFVDVLQLSWAASHRVLMIFNVCLLIFTPITSADSTISLIKLGRLSQLLWTFHIYIKKICPLLNWGLRGHSAMTWEVLSHGLHSFISQLRLTKNQLNPSMIQ